jgi:hypothetical protein
VHAVTRLPNDDLALAGAIELDGLAGSKLARLTTNDLTGNLVQVTATNALQLTAGAF